MIVNLYRHYLYLRANYNLAPIGDLFESKIKRIFYKKDSGNILPGHGGILDRLDSVLFCFPHTLIYVLFIRFYF